MLAEAPRAAAAQRPEPDALPERPPWLERVGLVLLLAAAAAVRALRWHETSLMFNDGPTFLALAKSLGEGRFADVIAHPYHPLYPLLVLIASFWVGDWERAAVLVSVISGAASVLCLWLFVRASLGREAAWIAAIFLAVQPRALVNSADIQSDGLYLALFLGAFVLLWHALQERRAALAGWTGIFAGLAYLARPEGLGIAIVAAALAVLYTVRRRWRAREAAGWIAALGAATLLVVLPYLSLLRVQNGSWILTQKKSAARLLALEEGGPAALLSQAPPWPLEAPAAPPAPEPPASQPGHAASETPPPLAPAAGLARAALAVIDAALGAVRPWFLALVLIGAWLRRGRPSALGELVWCVLGLYGAVLLTQGYHYGYVGTRHALPPLVLTFGYLAIAVPVVGRALLWPIERALGGRALPRVATAAAVGIVIAGALGQALRPERPGTRAERAAARWLAESARAPGGVAAPKVRVAYYAHRPYVSLYASPRGAALVPSLRQRGARYVILEDKKLSEFPEIGAAAGTTLRAVHVEEDRGRRAAVYELVDPGAEAGASDASRSPAGN